MSNVQYMQKKLAGTEAHETVIAHVLSVDGPGAAHASGQHALQRMLFSAD